MTEPVKRRMRGMGKGQWVRFCVVVSKETKAWVLKRSREQGITMSALVDEVLTKQRWSENAKDATGNV